jgi:hypothetical protein
MSALPPIATAKADITSIERLSGGREKCGRHGKTKRTQRARYGAMEGTLARRIPRPIRPKGMAAGDPKRGRLSRDPVTDGSALWP